MRFTYLCFYSLVVLIKSFSTHKCTHRATGIHLFICFYSLVVLIKSFSTHKCTHRATGIHLFICFYSLVVLIKSFSTHKRIQSSVWSFLKINVLPSVTGFTYLFLYFYCVDQNNSQPTNILQFKYSVITVEFPQIRFLLLLHSVLSLLS